jgi:glucosamine--fructose-6-phosphate aminotransferase (isomerizing)
MCGIVGYTGRREAAPLLVEGLRRLEYRGYDSAGLTIQNGCGLVTHKLAGRVAGLDRRIEEMPIHGTSGIAHTRWATHGAPNEVNAHPHLDCTGAISVVHNGIIENADLLRVTLQAAGHVLQSDTDTETLAHLIEAAEGDLLETRVLAALALVEGTYGLAVMWNREPGKLVVARHGSPLLVGVGEGEYFVASDASAVLEHTRNVVYLDDGDLAVISADGYRIIDRQARAQHRTVSALDWAPQDHALGGHPHYMHKEIFEQPETVHATMRGRLLFEDGTARLNGLNLTSDQVAGLSRIVIVGCGTSWHAALVGRHVIEELTGMPVVVEYASEYRYRRVAQVPGTLCLAVSQSGETADTLEAIRAARRAGCLVRGIVNVVGSTIARETDGGIYCHAGPEVGVASTKAFTSQVVALLLLALHLGRQRGLSPDDGRALVFALSQLPALIRRALETDEAVRTIAEAYAQAPNALYLGRGVNFPVALEGALKLKEISYIHAEGYPAAEMKHGPIALIDEAMPVFFVAPADEVFGKVRSNMQEVKARGGRIIAITSEDAPELGALADHEVRVPESHPLLSPVITAIPLQLLAYHIAVLRGCDVDRPRNLAKSVTVE